MTQRRNSRAARDVKNLLQAQAAVLATAAGAYAQWAGIAARVVQGGADRLADLAELSDNGKPIPPDGYERVAARLVADYERGVREAAALPGTAVLRFARELQKIRTSAD